MAILTVNGDHYDVVGAPFWSLDKIIRGRPAACLLSGFVIVPANRLTTDLDQTNATVRLTLSNGRRFEGSGLYYTGDLQSSSDGVTDFKYEGVEILEI